MKRLVVFGCSYAYGHGLQDCCEKDGQPGPAPSNFAWPAVMAKKLHVELSNQSRPGSSNIEILHKIKSFNFRKGDVCIVHWSFIERWCKILDRVDQIEYYTIGPWQDNKTAKGFFNNVYNDTTGVFLSKVHADFIGYYLKDIGIKYISFEPIIYHTVRNTLEVEYSTPHDYKNLCHFHNKILYPFADTALDNAHPGPETHKRFAEYILEEYSWLKE